MEIPKTSLENSAEVNGKCYCENCYTIVLYSRVLSMLKNVGENYHASYIAVCFSWRLLESSAFI